MGSQGGPLGTQGAMDPGLWGPIGQGTHWPGDLGPQGTPNCLWLFIGGAANRIKKRIKKLEKCINESRNVNKKRVVKCIKNVGKSAQIN